VTGTLDVSGVKLLELADIDQLEIAPVLDQPVAEFLDGDMVIARGNHARQTGRPGAEVSLGIVGASGYAQHCESH
jgi:hypothetical protein